MCTPHAIICRGACFVVSPKLIQRRICWCCLHIYIDLADLPCGHHCRIRSRRRYWCLFDDGRGRHGRRCRHDPGRTRIRLHIVTLCSSNIESCSAYDGSRCAPYDPTPANLGKSTKNASGGGTGNDLGGNG
ncbi:MAG: hypothetical protein FGM33_06105 [Candidatus Kapabacteria bacterium]|nr:hypothetical protein [Candidatus Kapabacteria bacterium]